jgi:hypothetical protein
VEREITAPIDLVSGGHASGDALGWSRRAVHRCRVDGPWGRRKRWHHWAVTSAREVVAVTFADLDYLGLLAAFVIDRASGRVVRDVQVRPGGWRVPLPDSASHGRVSLGEKLEIHDSGAHVTLRARTRRLSLDLQIDRPDELDTLGVAVEWPGTRGRRFAYTSKQAGLPARGTITVDGATRAVAPGALACLDWGRGVWPARTRWNWASAAAPGLSFNLGAQWTHGTTENALVVDGRLRKIAAPVRFDWTRPDEPWHLRGDGVDLTLVPEHVERAPGLRLAFGAFHGRILDTDVRELFGWAEELRVTW